jgi:putative copper resistance protein D
VNRVIWVTGTAVLILGLALSGNWWQESATGIPDSGPIIHLLTPLLEYLSALLGVVTLSYLLSIVVFLPHDEISVLSPVAKRFKIKAKWMSLVWFATGLLAAQTLLIKILGVSPSNFFSIDVFITYAWELNIVRALILTALVALVIFFVLQFSNSVETVGFVSVTALIGATFSALTAHAAGVSGHALATTSGFIHVLGMSVWLAGVIALYRHLSAVKVIMAKEAISRFGKLATVSLIAVVISGVANSLTRMDSITQVFTTNYGRLVLVKITLTFMAIYLASLFRSRWIKNSTNAIRYLLLEISLLLSVLAVASIVANSAFPKSAGSATTLIEQLTGYPEPSEINWYLAFIRITPDALTLIAGLLAVLLYLAALRRLVRRGDIWSGLRTASWLAGVIVGVWVTNTEISRYALVSMSAHMTQHMALGMLVPILLVLGAPITLGLRALSPGKSNLLGPREWIVIVLQSRYSKLITHPLVALTIYSGSIYVVYFSSLMTSLMSSHLGHVAMHLHFVLSGYLFFWLIIGTDFQPRQIGYPFKLILVLMSMVIHAVFGLILMQSTSLVGGGWFGQVAPIWLTDVIADQQLAGGIAWSFGELPMLLVFIALGVQWAKSDRQLAARLDRQADTYGDSELSAYNEMLERLNNKGGKD